MPTAGRSVVRLTTEFESTQNMGSSKSDAEEQGDEESFSIRIGPGEERRISAKRQVGPMKYVITGWGDLEHGIIIGKHWDGKWQGHRGKRTYPRHAEWASFADFLIRHQRQGRARLGRWLSGSRTTRPPSG